MSRTSTIVFALGVLAIASLIIVGCPPEMTATITEQSEPIGPAGGRLALDNPASGRQGAFVEIPAGALSDSVNVTLSASFNTSLTLDGSSPPLSLISLGPTGQRFALPVRVGLPCPAGRDASALALYWHDGPDAVWVPLAGQSFDDERRVISGSINHFSTFALGNRSAVDFTVSLYYDGSRLWAGVSTTTPLSQIPLREESATEYGADSMLGILDAAPLSLRPSFTVTLRQNRAAQTDSVLSTVTIQYQVSDVVGDDELPAEVAVRVNQGPASLHFPIDGERQQALAQVELLFSGQPVLFEFAGLTPSAVADYYVTVALEYVDEQGFVHNPLVARSQSAGGRAFELNTKSRLIRLADMLPPPDSDADGVIDTFADFGATSSRPVTAPAFLTGGVTSFADTLNVLVACGTPGASIVYTTDGTTPTRENGTPAPCATFVTLTETTTLQAISIKDGRPDSEVVSQQYTRTTP